MWILPKKYQMSCHYAQDTVASKEDLSLPGVEASSRRSCGDRSLRRCQLGCEDGTRADGSSTYLDGS